MTPASTFRRSSASTLRTSQGGRRDSAGGADSSCPGGPVRACVGLRKNGAHVLENKSLRARASVCVQVKVRLCVWMCVRVCVLTCVGRRALFGMLSTENHTEHMLCPQPLWCTYVRTCLCSRLCNVRECAYINQPHVSLPTFMVQVCEDQPVQPLQQGKGGEQQPALRALIPAEAPQSEVGL